MDISQIINLNIDLQTGSVDKQGFSDLLIVGAHAGFTDRIKSYTALSGLTSSDEFTTHDAIYRAVRAYFAAKPRKPRRVWVGRRDVDYLSCAVLSASDNTEYTHTINGVEYTYTTGVGETVTDIATGISALINAAHPGLAVPQLLGIYLIMLSVVSVSSNVDGTKIIQNNWAQVTLNPYDANTTYIHEINGETFTTQGELTVEAAIDDLVAKINASTTVGIIAYPGGIVAPYSNYAILSSKNMSDFVSTVDTDGVGTGAIAETYPGISETWSDCLDAIRNAGDTWYGLSVVNRNIAQQLAVATWTENQLKLHGYATEDDDVINTTATYDTVSIPARLMALGYWRTWGIYNAGANGGADDNFADTALFGRMLTYDPDVETANWAYKTLTGCTVDALTSTQLTNTIGDLFTGSGGKNINVYVSTYGQSITLPGKVAAGEWIHTILGRDWLYFRITEAVLYVFTNNKKVSYSDKGIALIASQITTYFEKGITTEFLLRDIDEYGIPGYSVTYPTRSEAAVADVANQVLKNVEGKATVANAILVTEMNVSLSV